MAILAFEQSNGEHALGRILLVEDEPELRRVLRRALTRAGFEVAEAANGSAALDLLCDGYFDAVISDVRMPGMGGLELLKHLLEQAPDLPVVLMSGSSELGNRRSAVEVGAFDYLAKPISLSHLQSVALGAVALHRSPAWPDSDSELRESCERLRVAPVAASSGWK